MAWLGRKKGIRISDVYLKMKRESIEVVRGVKVPKDKKIEFRKIFKALNRDIRLERETEESGVCYKLFIDDRGCLYFYAHYPIGLRKYYLTKDEEDLLGNEFETRNPQLDKDNLKKFLERRKKVMQKADKEDKNNCLAMNSILGKVSAYLL